MSFGWAEEKSGSLSKRPAHRLLFLKGLDHLGLHIGVFSGNLHGATKAWGCDDNRVFDG
jgi:hypothetical protein